METESLQLRRAEGGGGYIGTVQPAGTASEQEWTVRFDNMIYAGEIFVTLISDKENRDRVVAMHNAAVDKVVADDAEIIVELEATLAAAQEKYLSEARSWFDRDKKLREQLAAERDYHRHMIYGN